MLVLPHLWPGQLQVMRAEVLALEALQAQARLEAQRWLVQAAAAEREVRTKLEALAAGGGGVAQVAWTLPLRAAVATPAKERRERVQTPAERVAVAMPLMAASKTWPVS